MKQKLFVAIPSGDYLPVRFVHSVLMMLLKFKGIQIDFGFGSGITNARNSLCMTFLASPCDRILFIDNDIVFEPEDIARLLDHDKDIVGGFYAKKKAGPAEWVCNSFEIKKPQDKNGLMEVRRLGTGFLMIKRKVLETVMQKFPEHAYIHPEGGEKFDFFTMGVVDGRYVSEDWYFCDRARAAGFKVWGDGKTILGHIGSAVYPLQG